MQLLGSRSCIILICFFYMIITQCVLSTWYWHNTLSNGLFCTHNTLTKMLRRGRERQSEGERLGPLTAFTLLAAFVTGDAVHVLSISDLTWWGKKGCVCVFDCISSTTGHI